MKLLEISILLLNSLFILSCGSQNIGSEIINNTGKVENGQSYSFDDKEHWVLDGDKKVNVEPHNFLEWENESEESKERKCEVCGYVEHHDHKYKSEYSFDSDSHYYESICCKGLIKGKEKHTMEKSYYIEDDKFIEPISCNLCGYQKEKKEFSKTSVSDIQYAESNNEITITKINNYLENDLIYIPDKVNDKAVTGIELNPSDINKGEIVNLKVVLPRTIKSFKKLSTTGSMKLFYSGSIEDWLKVEVIEGATIYNCLSSFYYLENNEFVHLTDLKLPKEVTSINDYQFASFDIKKADLSNVKSIGKFAFAGCDSLKEVTLSETLEKIDEYGFSESGIRSLKLNQKNLDIKNYAFFGCHNLFSLSLGESISFTENSFSFTRIRKLNDKTGKLKTSKTLITSDSANEYIFHNEDFYFARANDKYYFIGYINHATSIDLPKEVYDGDTKVESYELYFDSIFENVITGGIILGEEGETSESSYSRFYGYNKAQSINVPSCVSKIDDMAISNMGVGFIEDIYFDFTQLRFEEICENKLNHISNRVNFHFAEE